MLRSKISILKVIFLIIVMIGSTSCFDAGKKETNAKAAFAVTSFIGGSWTGGAVIWAKGPSGQFKALTLNYGDAETVVNLESGSWQFMAAGWLGSSPAAGAIKCGKLGLELKDGDNSVPISLSQAGCTDSIFSPPEYQMGGSIKPIRLIACLAVTGTPTPGSNCNGAAKGNIRSYRIVLSQMNGGAPVPDFKTDCIDDPGGVASVSNTSIKIPLGYVGSTPLHTTIVGYSNPGCGTLEKVFVFKNGLINPSNNGDAKVVDEANSTEIYLQAPNIPVISAYTTSSAIYVTGASITSNSPTISGGTGPYVYTVSPSLPTGLSLSGGQVLGTPISVSPSTIYNITAQDADSTFSSPYAITIEVVLPAVMDIDNPAHNFGAISESYSGTQIFTYTNSGGANAVISTSTSSFADFVVTNDNCAGLTVSPGSTCTLDIVFTPGTPIGLSSTITLNYNDGASAVVETSTVSGTGIALPDLTISETGTYSFGTKARGSTTSHIFTITNVGGGTAFNLNGSVSGAPFTFSGGSFPGAGGDCLLAGTLGPGATCNIEVNYSPTVNGIANKAITMSHDDFMGNIMSSSTRLISGTGADPASIMINDNKPIEFKEGLNYPTLETEDILIKLENTGGVPAIITANTAGLATPFEFSGSSFPGASAGGTCTTTLAAGADCDIYVNFAPTTGGIKTDTLQISYNNGVTAVSSSKGIEGAGVVNIYRSYEYSRSAALDIGGGGNNVVVTTGVATFDLAVATTIGVGDMLVYDYDLNGVIDTIAMITKRISNTSFNIRPTNGVGAAPATNGGGNEFWKIYRAYTSLNGLNTRSENTAIGIDFDTFAWNLDASQQILHLAMFAGTVSTESPAFSAADYTTSKYNYLRVYAPLGGADAMQKQTHHGFFDNSTRSIISVPNNSIGITVDGVNFLRIEGMLFQTGPNQLNTGAALLTIKNLSTSSDVRITRSIFNMKGTSVDAAGAAIRVEPSNAASSEIRFWNNVIYSTTANTTLPPVNRCLDLLSSKIYAYNNTLYRCGNHGFYIESPADVTSINNIVDGTTNSTFQAGSGSYNVNSDYNSVWNGNTPAGGAGDLTSQASYTFSDTTQGNFDLSGVADGAFNVGVDLSNDQYIKVILDITGNARTGIWDIGAHNQ